MARKPDVQYIQFYIDGSAAREIAPSSTPKKHTAAPAKPRSQKVRTVFIDPVAISGIIVSAVMAVLMAFGSFALIQSHNEYEQMRSYVQTLQQENIALSEQYTANMDLADIEQKALALGMVPKAQAQQITIHVEPAAAEEQTTFWDKVGTFLSGLFA